MPSRRDSATKPATSSRVKALVTSSRGSTPTARSVTLANQFSSAIAGRSARTIMRQRRREDQRRAVGAGERDVLRHHLAEHDVQVADQAERDREGGGVHERLGDADVLERALEEVRDRGLAEVAEAERADRDAELGAGHHQRDVLHRVAA